jgi:hypothetical protein
MEKPHQTNYYLFHGIGITVTADANVSSAVHARLRHFKTNGAGSQDLHFQFRKVPDRDHHLVKPPEGKSRSVYDPPIGKVLYFDNDNQFYLDYDDQVRVLCDTVQGNTQVSILQSAADRLWLIAHPMFTLPFIELLRRRGLYNVHAAGLCLDGKALLFPGTSGAGKSTLTLTMLRAGFGFLGDDMMFLNTGNEGLRILAFPDEIDATDETIRFFPELEHLVCLPKVAGCNKQQIQAEDVYEAKFVPECSPAALFFPKIINAEKSVLKPMDEDEAFSELVPNILLTEAHSSQAHLDALAELVNASECYRLETGRDLHEVPKLLEGVMA